MKEDLVVVVEVVSSSNNRVSEKEGKVDKVV